MGDVTVNFWVLVVAFALVASVAASAGVLLMCAMNHASDADDAIEEALRDHPVT
jgi:hypothetical protein